MSAYAQCMPPLPSYGTPLPPLPSQAPAPGVRGLDRVVLIGLFAGLVIFLEIGFLEHLLLLVLLVLVIYIRNIAVRSTRQLVRTQQGHPEAMLRQPVPNGELPKPLPGNSNIVFNPLGEFYPIPYWEIYRDWDRSRWLNAIIANVWPQVSGFVNRMARSKLDSVLNKVSGDGKSLTLKLKTLDLGNIPLLVEAVKVYPTVRNYLTLDIKFRWVGNATIVLEGTVPGKVAVDVRVDRIHATGFIRGRISVIPTAPFIASVAFVLTAPPLLDFDVSVTHQQSKGPGGMELMSLPFVEEAVRKAVPLVVMDKMVFPNWFIIPIGNETENRKHEKRYSDAPEGALAVKLVQAKDLIKTDLFSDSDPYAVLTVGSRMDMRLSVRSRSQMTKPIPNNLNPRWNKMFTFSVNDRDTAVLKVELFDEDPGSAAGIVKDDPLGHCYVVISELPEGEVVDKWLTLEDVKNGQLRLLLLWLKADEDALEADAEGLQLEAAKLLERGGKSHVDMTELTFHTGGEGVVFRSKVWKRGANNGEWSKKVIAIEHNAVHVFDSDTARAPNKSFSAADCTLRYLGQIQRKKFGAPLQVLSVDYRPAAGSNNVPYRLIVGFDSEPEFTTFVNCMRDAGAKIDPARPPEGITKDLGAMGRPC